MTPLEAVREIIADCERDAAKLETRPFDARNVAEVFGETLAMLQALAKIVEPLLEHQHTYFGPAGLHGQWATTTAQRDTGAAAQKVFEEQQAAKLKAKAYEPRNEISDRFEPR